MLGADGVANLVIGRLRDRMPGRVALIRDRYGIDVNALPDIELFKAYEPTSMSVEKWPAVYVEIDDTAGKTGAQRESMQGAYDVYSFRYRVRVYVMARTLTGHLEGNEVEPMIRRYIAAAQEAVIPGLILVADDVHGQHATTDPNTLKQVYGAPQFGQDVAEIIGSARLEFEVKTTEEIEAVPGPLAPPPDGEPAAVLEGIYLFGPGEVIV